MPTVALSLALGLVPDIKRFIHCLWPQFNYSGGRDDARLRPGYP